MSDVNQMSKRISHQQCKDFFKPSKKENLYVNFCVRIIPVVLCSWKFLRCRSERSSNFSLPETVLTEI